MKRTNIIIIIAALMLISFGTVGVVALRDSTVKNSADQEASSQGLSEDEIRDGLMHHGADHEGDEH